MMIKTIISVVCFAIFATAVMAYVSLATPIGPWIAPTIMLLAMICVRSATVSVARSYVVYTTVGASLGGIIATAFGFTFATLYFLDASAFAAWFDRPFLFVALVAGLASAAGWFGMICANGMQGVVLADEQLPFPIARMLNKMLAVREQVQRAYELLAGFVGTFVFCALQDALICAQALIPRVIVLCQPMVWRCFSIEQMSIQLWPMLWSIGFVTGHVIAIPLLVGALSKIVVVQPLHAWAFAALRLSDVLMAFCSGMVASGAVSGCMSMLGRYAGGRSTLSVQMRNGIDGSWSFDRAVCIELTLFALCVMPMLYVLGMHVLMQCYLFVGTALCIYQIVLIAGKIGLAQLGRFATFVLVPALLLFQLDPLLVMVISLFVEVAAGVAVDVLCGRKLITMTDCSLREGRRYQYIGLVVSALVLGCVLYVLIDTFGLGSPELFAQRAQARALLVHVQQFNYWLVACGALFGLCIKKCRISPMLVLGGLLMPFNIMFGLVLGGMITYLCQDAERWYPLASGIFAANSLWMLLRVMV